MGKRANLLLLQIFLQALTILCALLAIVAWFAGIVPPHESHFITIISLCITPLLIANILFLILWAIKRKWIAMAPLAAIVLNLGFVAAMLQFDFRSESKIGRSDLKIATYNIHGFAQPNLLFTMSSIANFMKAQNVDVVCFQEFKETAKVSLDTIQSLFSEMPYRAAHAQQSGVQIAIFSRYPITNSRLVEFPQTNNSAMWADINVNNHNVRVFNVHFQTTSISQSQSEIAQVKNLGVTDIQGGNALTAILERVAQNSSKRAQQVSLVRQQIDTTSNKSIVVCGDFNDTPCSYTYKKMKEGLIDGFKTCGSGYAYTFQALFKLFRLDYILYDDHFQGVRYYSPHLVWSDHNPVLIELAFV